MLTPITFTFTARGLVTAMLIATLPTAAHGVVVVDNPAEIVAEVPSGQLRAGGFIGNDHVALKHFDSDVWPSDYQVHDGTNLTLLSARIGLGGSYRGLHVEYFKRSDWILRASEDTAHAYYITQTDQLITSGRNLQLDYRLHGFEADGIRFAFARTIQEAAPGVSLRIGLSANFLRGTRLRAEEIRGNYTSTGSTASLTATREIWYSAMKPSTGASGSLTDFLPFNEETVPTNGRGRSIDLGILVSSDKGWSVSVSANDLAGRLKWRNLPHVQQQITVNNLSEDTFEAGGIPVLTGFNDYRDYTMKLPVKYQARGTLLIDSDISLGTDVTIMRGQSFPRMAIDIRTPFVRRLTVDYETRFHTTGLAAQGEYIWLAFRTDRFSRASARSLGLEVQFRLPI